MLLSGSSALIIDATMRQCGCDVSCCSAAIDPGTLQPSQERTCFPLVVVVGGGLQHKGSSFPPRGAVEPVRRQGAERFVAASCRKGQRPCNVERIAWARWWNANSLMGGGAAPVQLWGRGGTTGALSSTESVKGWSFSG